MSLLPLAVIPDGRRPIRDRGQKWVLLVTRSRLSGFASGRDDVDSDVEDANGDGVESALRRRQRLLQVGDDVRHILQPDREPHHVRPGAGERLLLVGELAVRGRCRVDDQRAGVADIGEVGEQLDVRHHRDAGLVAAGETEGEDAAGALRRIALGEVVVAVAGKARIAHPVHLRMRRQILGNRQRIVAMALDAQRQRLDAGENQEGVEGRERRPEIAQAEHAGGDGEGEIAEGLAQHDALIFGARLRQERIAALAHPVEGAAIDDHAADGIAMAAKILGRRMDDDVGAVLDRAHADRASPGCCRR